MKAILDTHTFLWWIIDAAKLSIRVREIIRNPDNIIYISAASAWEIVIKAKLKRITQKEQPEKLIPEEIQKNSFQVLPIHLYHALKVYELPDIHKDPFDRILVAQSKIEQLPLLTRDKNIKKYGIKVIW